MEEFLRINIIAEETLLKRLRKNRSWFDKEVVNKRKQLNALLETRERLYG